MNDTIAVALITSLSTLTAAGLAGAVSARVSGRQLRHQAELAREERAEQRAVDHREMRRGAYERFLAEADSAYRVLDEGWFAVPFTGTPRWEEGFSARRALDEAYVRVALVGPEEVARSGRAVVRGIGAEFRLHARVLSAEEDGAERGGGERRDSAAGLDPAARSDALRARSAGTEGFVRVARLALGPELFSMPGELPGQAPGEPAPGAAHRSPG